MMGFVSSGNFVSARSARSAMQGRRGVVVASAETAPGKVKMWGDGTDGSSCPPAETEFAKKFAKSRGATIPTVTDTMAKFNASFSRPVPAVYRSVVNEILTLNHLTVFCAMWKYDSIYAYGFDEIFNRYFAYYPNAEEREKLIGCIVGSLEGLELSKIRSDKEGVLSWVEGKNEDDVLSMLEAGSTDGPVLEALQYVKAAEYYDWYYSRAFGFGLLFIIEKLGGELTESNAERWAEAIKISPIKLKDELGVYLSSLERLKQAEQMFADLSAREKKKTADRLAAEAKEAAAEAEEASKELESTSE